MLILTRSIGQTVNLHQQDDLGREFVIAITIARVNGSSVRLGIQAPSFVRIVREEIDAPVLSTNREVDGNV